jgi:hypothetical protein
MHLSPGCPERALTSLISLLARRDGTTATGTLLPISPEKRTLRPVAPPSPFQQGEAGRILPTRGFDAMIF